MSQLDVITNQALQPLESARSLPFSAYTDAEILQAETQQIFAKEWVFVCMDGELPGAGDYFALTLANEPVLIIRGDDGELRALSNICRHRGTLLLDEGFGSIDKYITCPYHAWAYSKQGELKAIPYNKVIAVDRAEHQLPGYQSAVWNGLVFVNLDPHARPLHERLANIDDYLGLFEPDTMQRVSAGEVEIWQSNWKLAMENAMESYHLFKVHENTLELYSPTRTAYYIAGSSEWSLTGGETQRRKGLVERMFGGNGHELHDHYILVSLPPSFVGILSYGSFGWLSAHPIDATTTRIRSGATYAGSASAAAQADDFTKAFFAEDKAMCERVQTGMGSRLTQGGKLVDLERVVVDFHQFLGTRLGGGEPTQLFEDNAAAQWKTAGKQSARP